MIKFIVYFASGIYTGIYLAQNYDVPPVNDPAAIMSNLKEFVEKHKKN